MGFQLILFDLIGKVDMPAVFAALNEGFQLILFDLIGKGGCPDCTDSRAKRFPTNPI